MAKHAETVANSKLCPFGHQFGSPITFCAGSQCMAWEPTQDVAEHPVGMDPGAGWVKDGPDTGIGGAVTHRQRWKRPAGYCGRVFRH